ncbi:hypothetical protein W02_42490 [Nitrospira sp. KM1]|uniref:hypothetical protein n=1 Tax=Nitrospira sp. KM1 TaxID=1936990 RepID=UPI0013A73C83|nr:hypothetical protein [Nitrospira sp. KM1]BCA57109.1 hypothetical protein W02_42490 [Nitrospira sp. KM1]
MVTMIKVEKPPATLPLTTSVGPKTVNRIAGTILATGTPPHEVLHVRTDEGASLDLRIDRGTSAPALRRFFAVGQRVMVAVDAAEVKLHVPYPQTENRCNEWSARVVLVERERSSVTVKILGQQVTLKSTSIDPSAIRPLRVWDSTKISIAPEAVHVTPLGTCSRLRRRLLTEQTTERTR